MDEELEEYTADMALDDAQREAEKGLKALERVNLYLDDETPAEVHEALEDVFKSLTRITWL